MAAKRERDIVDIDPDTGVPVIYETPADQATQADIAADMWADELKAGEAIALVNVYRQTSANGSLELCFSVSVDEMTPVEVNEKIRLEYGPGTYRLMIRQTRNGRNVLVENKCIRIAAPMNKVAAPSGDGMAGVLMKQMEKQAEFQEKMMERLERGGQPDAAKTLANIAAFVTAVSPILVPVINNVMRPRDSSAEMLKTLEIFGLVKELKEPSPTVGEGGWMDMVGKGFETLGTVLAMRSGGMLPPPQAAPTMVESQAGAVAITANPVDLPDVGLFVAQFDQFHQAAMRGDSPGAVARMLVDRIPPQVMPQVVAMVEHPLFIKAVVREKGEAALDIMDWLTYMREDFLLLTEPSDNDNIEHAGQDHADADTGRGRGDGGNTEPDGQTDQGGQG